MQKLLKWFVNNFCFIFSRKVMACNIFWDRQTTNGSEYHKHSFLCSIPSNSFKACIFKFPTNFSSLILMNAMIFYQKIIFPLLWNSICSRFHSVISTQRCLHNSNISWNIFLMPRYANIDSFIFLINNYMQILWYLIRVNCRLV